MTELVIKPIFEITAIHRGAPIERKDFPRLLRKLARVAYQYRQRRKDRLGKRLFNYGYFPGPIKEIDRFTM